MEKLLNEESCADTESAVMRRAIIITLVALSLVVVFMQPDKGEKTVKTAEALAPTVEQKPEVKPKAEQKVETKLTEEEARAKLIRENPEGCDQNTQYILWPDGKCGDKVVAVARSAVTPVEPTPVTGDQGTWLAASGIPENQWVHVDFIVSHESGWDPRAVNPSSGACGLGQQLPCGKWPGAWDDPVAALKAMDNYVERYGDWAGAVHFWTVGSCNTQYGCGWY